jgi:hypothetical protein
MNSSWKRPCWEYSESLLREYVGRPSGDRTLALAWQRDGRMLGFFAGVPIDVRAAGAVQRALFTSFLTVHKDARDPSMSIRMFQAVMDAARAHGRTHVYTVFQHDPETNRFVRLLFQRCASPMSDLLEFAFLTRPTQVRKPGAALRDARIVAYSRAHRDAARRAFERMAARAQIAQIVPEMDLDALLANGCVTRLFVRGGEVKGLLGGRHRTVLHRQTLRNVHVDFVWIDELTPAEQDAFLDGAFAEMLERHTAAFVVPSSGYFDATPFLRNGFLRFPSKATLAVSYLSPSAQRLAPLTSSFFEVY